MNKDPKLFDVTAPTTVIIKIDDKWVRFRSGKIVVLAQTEIDQIPESVRSQLTIVPTTRNIIKRVSL